jgi:hypothetical protein
MTILPDAPNLGDGGNQDGGNIMPHFYLPTYPSRLGLFILLSIFALVVSPSHADVDLAVLPANISVEPGEIFDVELTVTLPGAAFNGYDAVVGFDSAALTFIQLSPIANQEGPLMTDACNNMFHQFNVSASGDTLTINHLMLCAATSVTGPGVVYRLRFQAGEQETTTSISLLPGTAFFFAGLYVNPVFTWDSEVHISQVSPVPADLVSASVNLIAAPNPFNPMTTISFESAEAMHARISVYSSRGSLITELLDDQVSTGRNSVVWDGRDIHGQKVGSGTYLVRLDLGGELYLQRVTLIK